MQMLKTPVIQGGPGSPGMIAETIKLDTDYSPTKYVHEVYWYDSMNRVIRYFKYEVDSSARPVHIDTIQVIHFDYAVYPADTGVNLILPAYSLEDYRTSLYYLANAAHMYQYDKQNRLVLDTLIDFYKGGTDRGVVISRRVHYNTASITVDNLNLDTYTSITGSYRDSIVTDANGNPVSTTTLNGSDFVTRNLDNFNIAGYLKNTSTYNNLENPFNKMNVSNLLAFVQTGFPGGSFYETYLAKNFYTSVSSSLPQVPVPQLTSFKYITNPLMGNRVEKIIISRVGANEHGGFIILKYY
jgi:hypothetical protein